MVQFYLPQLGGYKSLNWANQSKHGEDEANNTKTPENNPFPCPRSHPSLPQPHFHRKIYSQRPKIHSSKNSQYLIEVREKHCNPSCWHNISCPKKQPSKIQIQIWQQGQFQIVASVDKWSVLWSPFVHNSKYGLRIHLMKIQESGSRTIHSSSYWSRFKNVITYLISSE